MDEEVRSIMMEGVVEFLILMCVGGAILYYAYRKDKSNIKIAYYDELTGLPNGTYLERISGRPGGGTPVKEEERCCL